MCGPRTERQANARGYYWVKMVFDGAVIRALRRSSPGAMEHSIDGLSAKVFNERLRKLTRYGLLDKRSFAEMPPRVEHRIWRSGLNAERRESWHFSRQNISRFEKFDLIECR